MKLSSISIVFMFIGMSWVSADAAASKRPTETVPLGIHLVELGDFDPQVLLIPSQFLALGCDSFQNVKLDPNSRLPHRH